MQIKFAFSSRQNNSFSASCRGSNSMQIQSQTLDQKRDPQTENEGGVNKIEEESGLVQFCGDRSSTNRKCPISWRVMLLIIFTYYGLIALVEAGIRTVAAQEGKTVTLQPLTPKLISNEQFIWTFTSTELISKSQIVQSQVFKGEVHTDYKGKFKDSLLLNRSTGSLTIRNITASQSGLYHLQITHENGSMKEWNFNCTVYAPVSAPVISKETFQPKNLPPSRITSRPSSSCRVLCSVRNDRDVSLYWFRANELLSQTSSPDVNSTLSLCLDLDNQDNSTYSCVSANPVSNHTTSLDIPAVCSSGNQPD